MLHLKIKEMKKLSLVLAGIMFLLTVNVMAQGRGGNPEERMKKQVDHLKVMLELSDEQFASIKDIMSNSQVEMKTLQEDAQKEREAKNTDMKVIRTAEQEDIKLLLSADQKVKFEEMLKMREEQMNGREGRGKGKPKHNK
ncbi:MAG: protein CpxP [Marivirga sp.]|jgi:protein CpxP